MSETIHVVPGDELTLHLRGKVADPSKAHTAEAVTFRIFRPGRPGGLLAAVPHLDIHGQFEADVEVKYDVKSRFKNGVWIDTAGRYWMRRPDGWHEMTIRPMAVPSLPGTQFAPPGVTRLKEDKDT